ncbi:MAG: hypothetical protein NXI24_24870 [bacterium]|nr:hypothetical protein [bacterium]
MLALDWIGFGSLIALLVFSGLYRSLRTRDESAYLFASRRTGLFALTATLVMTEFNPTTLLAFSSVGFFAGWWGLSLPFVFLAGLAFYALVVARHWKRFDGSSVAELFTLRYGVLLGRTASAALLLAMAGFSATYIRSLVLIFGPLAPEIGELALSVAIVGLVLLITLRGGLLAVIRTDIVSFVAVCLVIPAIVYAIGFAAPGELADAGAGEAKKISFEAGRAALPPAFVFSLVLLTMFTYILAPWYGQKIFAARSEKVAFASVALSAVIVFALYGAMVAAVYFARLRGLSVENPETALPAAVQLFAPAGVRGVAYGLFLLAGATTLAGVWNAMTAMLRTDFLGGGVALQSTKGAAASGESTDPAQKRLRGDIAITGACAAISLVLANVAIDRVLDKLILANIPVAALSFALLGAFYWPRASKVGAFASVLVGLAWGVFSYLYFGEAGMYTWYWVVYGLPAIFAVGIAGSLLWPPVATAREI